MMNVRKVIRVRQFSTRKVGADRADGVGPRRPTGAGRARRAGMWGAALLLLLGVLCGVTPSASAIAEPDQSAPTTVSLTFDDGFASQLNAQQMLAEHHMNGTFYIPSGFIGLEGRLTLPQIQAIQADGNEIGGHTVNHRHLPLLDPAEQARQICDDRVALSQDGLRVTSFAYPFAGLDASAKQVVQNCGYNSARAEEGLSAGGDCPVCPSGESMPPADPYSLRTATPVISSTTLSSIQQQIADAQANGGGWVPIVFHEVCDGCSDMAISLADFAALLDWLDSRAGDGIAVATVDQVIGGAVQNPIAGPPDQRPDGQLVNPSLEALTPFSYPEGQSECWEQSGFGVNTAAWARVPSAHSGSWAEQVSMESRTSGDQKLITRQDSGSCSPAVKPGRSYTLSAWYTSTAPTRMVAFYRKPGGAWVYWTGSPQADPSADWTQLTWQTPAIPADATRLSFGLQLADVGTLTIDDYAMTPDPSP